MLCWVMSQEGEGIEMMEELKVYVLLGLRSMDTQMRMTFLSSCKLHSQRH